MRAMKKEVLALCLFTGGMAAVAYAAVLIAGLPDNSLVQDAALIGLVAGTIYVLLKRRQSG